MDRFKAVLKQDPEFTNRDAVYFYLGEALVKGNQKAEALPYYEKLIEEFQQSEYLADAEQADRGAESAGSQILRRLRMRSRGVLVLSAIVVLGHAASVYAQSAPALSAADVAVACAPSLTVVPERPPVHNLRIVGAQDTVPRTLFGKRDLVVISGGTSEGVQLDQRYAIRRAFVFGRSSKGQLQTIHTTGWLRIVAVNDMTAIAQVEQVCDGVIAGDYLEPFVATAPLSASSGSAPANLDFSSLGRVLFGDEERRIAAPGDFMMLERGGAAIAPGTRVAVYRDLQTTGVPLDGDRRRRDRLDDERHAGDAHHHGAGRGPRAATTWCRTSRGRAGPYPAFLSDRCSRATVMSATRGLRTTLNRRK